MGMESPFYRGLAATSLGYPGYSPSLMHPSIGGPTPFMPPTHIPPLAPKVSFQYFTKIKTRQTTYKPAIIINC